MEKVKQKNSIKYILSTLLILVLSLFSLTACDVEVTPAISIGFKTNGQTSGEYSEAIEEFIIGQRFYCAIDVKLVTNKKKTSDFIVEVTIPKTTEVTMTDRGGIQPIEKLEDETTHTTILKYSIGRAHV